MNQYLDILKEYVDANMPICGCDCVDSLLETLGCCHSQNHPVDAPQVLARFRELDEILSKLTLHENDQVFSLTCQLCDDYRQQAFRDGILVGFRLFQELNPPVLP